MQYNKNFWRMISIFYIILSAIFILLSIWNYIRFAIMQTSFNQGRRATIEELISQSQNPNCQPIPVFTEEKKIEVLNAECVKKTETPEAQK